MLETLIAESKPDQEHWERFGFCRCWGKYGIEKVVQRLGVDVVVCCSDSEFASVSVAARECRHTLTLRTSVSDQT